MTGISNCWGHAAIAAAYLLGGSSLLLFGAFLFLGPLFGIELGLSSGAALGLDGVLCLAFFLQHSLMVRRSFRRRFEGSALDPFYGAAFTIASGIALLVLLLLWQPAGPTLASAEGPLRWVLRGSYALATLGFLWGLRSLSSFDVFGVRPILVEMYGKTTRVVPLTIRGPYRWVRHPMYSLFLVLLWSFPDLTADRLLLNSSWTIWIWIGSVLEERDLVSEFGEAYREYQRRVPMLLPTRVPRRS